VNPASETSLKASEKRKTLPPGEVKLPVPKVMFEAE
jgi:hypothetical protein